MKTIRLSEFRKAIKEQDVGDFDIAFICPMCKTVQSPQDFIDLGLSSEKMQSQIGFSCIGRQTGAGSPRKTPDGEPCNYTLGGLFVMNELEVIDENGNNHPHFDLATPEQAQNHSKSRADA